jgi:hypothetical protein
MFADIEGGADDILMLLFTIKAHQGCIRAKIMTLLALLAVAISAAFGT